MVKNYNITYINMSYYEKNKEICKQKSLDYYYKNREIINEKNKQYFRNVYYKNPIKWAQVNRRNIICLKYGLNYYNIIKNV